MSKQIQFINISPEENNKPVFDYIDKKFEELKKFYEPKTPTEYLTIQETTDLLKANRSSIYAWTKRGILQSFGIQGRRYYKRSDIEEAMIKLKK